MGVKITPVTIDLKGVKSLELNRVDDGSTSDPKHEGKIVDKELSNVDISDYLRLFQGSSGRIPQSYLDYLTTKVLIYDKEEKLLTFFRVSGNNNPINVFGLRIVPETLDVVVYNNAMDLEQGYIRVGNLQEFFTPYGIMRDRGEVLEILLESKLGKKTFLKTVEDLKKATSKDWEINSTSVLLASLSSTFSEEDALDSVGGKLWGNIDENFISILCQFGDTCRHVLGVIDSIQGEFGSSLASFSDSLIDRYIPEQKNDEQFMMEIRSQRDKIRSRIHTLPISPYEVENAEGTYFLEPLVYLQKISGYAPFLVGEDKDERDADYIRDRVMYGYDRQLIKDSDIEVMIKKNSYNYIDMLMRSASSELFYGFGYSGGYRGYPRDSFTSVQKHIDDGDAKKAFNYLANDLYKQFEDRTISVSEINFASIVDLLLSNREFYDDYFDLMYRDSESGSWTMEEREELRLEGDSLVVDKIRGAVSGLMAEGKIDKILDVFRNQFKYVTSGGRTGSRGYLDTFELPFGSIPTVVDMNHDTFGLYHNYMSSKEELMVVVDLISSLKSRSRVISKVLDFMVSKF